MVLHGTGRRVPESREERVCAAGSKPRPGRWLTTCSRPPRCARSRGGRTPGRFSSSHLERPVRATTGHCEVARGRVSRPGWTGHLGRARGRGSGRTHSPPRDRAGLPCRTAPPPQNTERASRFGNVQLLGHQCLVGEVCAAVTQQRTAPCDSRAQEASDPLWARSPVRAIGRVRAVRSTVL